MRTVLDVYGHVFESIDSEAAERLDKTPFPRGPYADQHSVGDAYQTAEGSKTQ